MSRRAPRRSAAGACLAADGAVTIVDLGEKQPVLGEKSRREASSVTQDTAASQAVLLHNRNTTVSWGEAAANAN
jgi:hypothetical protein